MVNRILIVLLEAVMVAVVTHGFIVERRSAASDRSSDEYPDYQLGVKYDEYPMVVPKKKTALLMDRLLVALKRVLEEEEAMNRGYSTINEKNLRYSNRPDIREMDLQRRGEYTYRQQYQQLKPTQQQNPYKYGPSKTRTVRIQTQNTRTKPT